jgi:hypothetical protein
MSQNSVQIPLEQQKDAAKSFTRDHLKPFLETVERAAALANTPFGDRQKLELAAGLGVSCSGSLRSDHGAWSAGDWRSTLQPKHRPE